MGTPFHSAEGLPPNVDVLYPREELKTMLAACDILFIAVPYTPHTVGMVGAAELAALPKGAFLLDVSRGGVLPLSRHLDHLGAFARSLPDLALVLDVIAGYDPADADTRPFAVPDFRAMQREKPPVPPRFAFVRTPVWDKADGDTKAAFEEFVATLGAAVEPIDLPQSWAEAWEIHRTIMATEMAHNLAPFVARGEPSEMLRKLLSHGRSVAAVDYLGALAKVPRYAASLAEIFDTYDAIITPAAVGVAPKGLGSTGDPVFCTLWTLTGLPALSSMKLTSGNRNSVGLPSRISNLVLIDDPTTCSGGTPYTRSVHGRMNSTPPPDTMKALKSFACK